MSSHLPAKGTSPNVIRETLSGKRLQPRTLSSHIGIGKAPPAPGPAQKRRWAFPTPSGTPHAYQVGRPIALFVIKIPHDTDRRVRKLRGIDACRINPSDCKNNDKTKQPINAVPIHRNKAPSPTAGEGELCDRATERIGLSGAFPELGIFRTQCSTLVTGRSRSNREIIPKLVARHSRPTPAQTRRTWQRAGMGNDDGEPQAHHDIFNTRF
jgi:hypothetical protein